MPITPSKPAPVELEFEVIKFRMPLRQTNKEPCPIGKKLDAMTTDPEECVWVPKPNGETMDHLGNRLGRITKGAQERSKGKKKFTRRQMKRGAIEGYGLWRLQ